ncbi:MAG: hypothetical protein RR327_05310, partial [Clostridia bacterium]
VCNESKLELKENSDYVWKFTIVGDTDDYAFKVVFTPDVGAQTILADSSYTQAIKELVVPKSALSSGRLDLIAYDKNGNQKVIAFVDVVIPKPTPTPA